MCRPCIHQGPRQGRDDEWEIPPWPHHILSERAHPSRKRLFSLLRQSCAQRMLDRNERLFRHCHVQVCQAARACIRDGPRRVVVLLVSWAVGERDRETQRDRDREHPNPPPLSVVLRVLCGILTDGADAPPYKALIDAGLGSDYAPNTGMDTSVFESGDARRPACSSVACTIAASAGVRTPTDTPLAFLRGT
jgi:hypothetical protein